MHEVNYHDLWNRVEDVGRLARDLENLPGGQYVELTENSTKLRLVIHPRDYLTTAKIDGVPCDAGYLFVAVIEHGCYWFAPRAGLHESYVAQKLGINRKDADAVVWLLNQIGMLVSK